VKARRALGGSLDATLEVAKPLRIRLTQWYQNMPAGLAVSWQHRQAHELNGHGALHLAYMTAKVELFRAMLRPSATDANSSAGAALRTGAIAVAKELVDFLEMLDASHLEAFWPSCKISTS